MCKTKLRGLPTPSPMIGYRMNRNEKLIAHPTSHLIAKRAIDSVILLIDLPPLDSAALASPAINITITEKKTPS